MVLGLAEDGDKLGADVVPIPRCRELAERLLQAATAKIDPPIPLLDANGSESKGQEGVVVLRVPASRMAPHQAPDLQCYVRRGTSSEPMRMRESRT